MAAAALFLVFFLVCIVLAAAWSIFGHAAWIAMFEPSTFVDARYPPPTITLQKANERLGKLSAFYKSRGFSTDLKTIAADPKCIPSATDTKGVCGKAIDHDYPNDCFQACLEKYYADAGCHAQGPGVEPSPHCWNVYSGMAFGKTAPMSKVREKSADFTQEQKNVYDIIKKKDAFILSEYGRIVTDKACKRPKDKVPDSQLQALGGDDCLSIRND